MRLADPEQKAKALAQKEARKPKHRGYGRLVAYLRERIAGKYVDGRLRRWENGSLRAAVELNCLECCQGDVESIRSCTSASKCPLHPHRPFQTDPTASVEDVTR